MSAAINPYLRKQPWRPRGKGLNGRPLCYCGCGQEIPANTKRRTSVPGHYEAWRQHSDLPYIRRQVFERDRGVCQLCGVDTAIKARTARETERLLRWLAMRHAEALFHAGQLDIFPGFTPAAKRYSTARRRALGEHHADYRDVSSWADYWVTEQMTDRFGTTMGSQCHTWEADHIIPVSEGGGGCGIEGYRTLCIECHRRETGLLAGRTAGRRRAPPVVSTVGGSSPAARPIGPGDADQPNNIAPAAGGIAVNPRPAAPTELAIVEHAAPADLEALVGDVGRDGPREDPPDHPQDGKEGDVSPLLAQHCDPLARVPDLVFDFTDGESKP